MSDCDVKIERKKMTQWPAWIACGLLVSLPAVVQADIFRRDNGQPQQDLGTAAAIADENSAVVATMRSSADARVAANKVKHVRAKLLPSFLDIIVK
jgi:hypothetical protein